MPSRNIASLPTAASAAAKKLFAKLAAELFKPFRKRLGPKLKLMAPTLNKRATD